MRKTILLFGEKNEFTEHIASFLHSSFAVEISNDLSSAADGMIRLVQPDLIFINLLRDSGNFREVFLCINQFHCKLPVIIFGSVEACDFYSSLTSLGNYTRVSGTSIDSNIVKACHEYFSELDTPAPSPVVENNVGPKHILLVDDSALQLRTTQTLLGDDYKISVALSAAQALGSISKERPDLIILDYDMPSCNGLDFFSMLHKSDEYKDIPVIFLTGVSDKEDIKKVIPMHPAGYLLKPVTRDDLLIRVEKALEL